MSNIEKKVVNEEMHPEAEWFKDARNQTKETLIDFINHMMNDYFHDYGTICHAISACMLATMTVCDNYDSGGITGFQASAVMWDIIRNITLGGMSNKSGMKIIDYDNILFPQYDYKFDCRRIPKHTFEVLVELAKTKLEEVKSGGCCAHPVVVNRWECLASGNVPDGFTVVEG